MREGHFINYRCNERSKATKIKSEVGQIFKTTYHLFALSIESWRLSPLMCALGGAELRMLTFQTSRFNQNTATGVTATATHNKEHPEKSRAGRGLFLIQNNRCRIGEGFAAGDGVRCK